MSESTKFRMIDEAGDERDWAETNLQLAYCLIKLGGSVQLPPPDQAYEMVTGFMIECDSTGLLRLIPEQKEGQS